jgi:type II secretory pathway pseudopilin PulG
MSSKRDSKLLTGFTLVETLIGLAVVAIVFLGIFGAYQLGIKVLGQSKARVGAIALADKQMETIRNLSYADVGTYSCKPAYPNCDPGQPSTIIQGYPYGKIKNSYQSSANNILYTIVTKIDYAVDGFDGIAAPVDSCPNDYKKVKVSVSWGGNFPGEADFDTIIAPATNQEECAETGGVLKATVFDSLGAAVFLPNITATNIHTGLTKTVQPESGVAYITLPPDDAAYRVEATKSGYSSERTYGIGEVYNGQTIATPTKPNATLIEGKLTEISFSIDKLSSLSVNSYAEGLVESFTDSFFDASKIASSSQVVIAGGAVKLAKSDPTHYYGSGYIISQTIEPAVLTAWNELNYTDDTPPNTKIRYQVLYFDGSNWVLVPDQDLPGNSSGLKAPPIDLSRMDKAEYPKIRLQATLLSQSDHENTPTLYDWTATWFSANPTVVNSIVFNLKGQKTVGETSSKEPVYKYSQNHQTSGGSITIPDLEWDSYSFSVDKGATGFDLMRTDPVQPINLVPDSNQAVSIFLKAENSLLVFVSDNSSGQPIFSANARLYNVSLSYDRTLLTDENGRVLFFPLSAASYALVVGAAGHQNSTSTVSVSGSTSKIINLIPQ